MFRARTWLVVLAAAALVFAVGGVFGLRRGAVVAPADAALAAAPRDALGERIARAQARLAKVPGDYATWAALGVAYVEKARVSADPGYYPKAEGALRRSLDLRPSGNAAALTGMGALANARHEFAAARDWAMKALQDNAFDADTYAVLADAYTQLGQSAAATEAVQRLLDLRPGLPAYTRASYDLEQRGRVDEARALMEQALATAVDPSDIAFCRYHLGELAWHAGDLAGAEKQYDAGFAADPSNLTLQEGRAKVAAAKGRLDAAVAGYADLTARSPSPGYLLAYAELLRSAGRGDAAAGQLALADAALGLFGANGGTDDLAAAALATARGRPATEAVALASREWERRQHADVADTLAWALHLAGRDAEARGYAERAVGTGARNATYEYHLGVVLMALGDRAGARAHLSRALATNPYFSPLDAPLAVKALASLGDS